MAKWSSTVGIRPGSLGVARDGPPDCPPRSSIGSSPATSWTRNGSGVRPAVGRLFREAVPAKRIISWRRRRIDWPWTFRTIIPARRRRIVRVPARGRRGILAERIRLGIVLLRRIGRRTPRPLRMGDGQ